MKQLLSVLFLALLIGCATFSDTAGKVLASTAQTVDSTMHGWAAYVNTKHISAGDQLPVRKAYGQYQLAMAAAEAAYISLLKTGDRTAWTKAADALIASQASLIAAIQSFTKAKP